MERHHESENPQETAAHIDDLTTRYTYSDDTEPTAELNDHTLIARVAAWQRLAAGNPGSTTQMRRAMQPYRDRLDILRPAIEDRVASGVASMAELQILILTVAPLGNIPSLETRPQKEHASPLGAMLKRTGSVAERMSATRRALATFVNRTYPLYDKDDRLLPLQPTSQRVAAIAVCDVLRFGGIWKRMDVETDDPIRDALLNYFTDRYNAGQREYGASGRGGLKTDANAWPSHVIDAHNKIDEFLGARAKHKVNAWDASKYAQSWLAPPGELPPPQAIDREVLLRRRTAADKLFERWLLDERVTIAALRKTLEHADPNPDAVGTAWAILVNNPELSRNEMSALRRLQPPVAAVVEPYITGGATNLIGMDQAAIWQLLIAADTQREDRKDLWLITENVDSIKQDVWDIAAGFRNLARHRGIGGSGFRPDTPEFRVTVEFLVKQTIQSRMIAYTPELQPVVARARAVTIAEHRQRTLLRRMGIPRGLHGLVEEDARDVRTPSVASRAIRAVFFGPVADDANPQ